MLLKVKPSYGDWFVLYVHRYAVPASVIDKCPLSIMSKHSLTVVDAAAWVTGVPNSSTGEFSLQH